MAVVGTSIAAAKVSWLGELGGLAGAIQAIADAAHGDDFERRDAGELFTQPADVHVHGLAIARELVAPDVFEQDVAGVHAAREGQQVGEEVELANGQLDVAAIEHHAARGAVDAELSDGVALGDGLGLVGVWGGPAQDGVDAGQDLANRKRLGYVVVGS